MRVAAKRSSDENGSVPLRGEKQRRQCEYVECPVPALIRRTCGGGGQDHVAGGLACLNGHGIFFET